MNISKLFFVFIIINFFCAYTIQSTSLTGETAERFSALQWNIIEIESDIDTLNEVSTVDDLKTKTFKNSFTQQLLGNLLSSNTVNQEGFLRVKTDIINTLQKQVDTLEEEAANVKGVLILPEDLIEPTKLQIIEYQKEIEELAEDIKTLQEITTVDGLKTKNFKNQGTRSTIDFLFSLNAINAQNFLEEKQNFIKSLQVEAKIFKKRIKDNERELQKTLDSMK